MVASNKFLDYLLGAAVILYYKFGVERSVEHVNQSYDFVVVGGGSAGAIVAAKLSEIPFASVLLIESGGSGSPITDIPFIAYELFAKTNMSRLLYSEVQSNGVCDSKPCKIYQGHHLGGGSTHNTMAYVRGSKRDFTEWSNLGLQGWSYEDVLPSMTELENYEDQSVSSIARGHFGPVHVASQQNYAFNDIRKRWKRAAVEAGYEVGDYNGPRQTYFADMQNNVDNGVRQSTDNVFLQPIMASRSNLHVIMFSHVTRILFEGNTAIGVEYSRNGTLNKVFAKKQVLISAGALASPQILMLSGIGPIQQLKKFNIKPVVDSVGVGRNLQDHSIVSIAFETNAKYPANSQVTKANYELWKSEKKGILASVGGSVAFLSSNYSVESDDTQISILVTIRHNDANTRNVVLGAQVTPVRVLSRGFVQLKSSDPFDDVSINPRYLTSVEDNQNALVGVKTFLSLMKTKPFQEIESKLIVNSRTSICSDQAKMFSDDWLKCFIRKNTIAGLHFTSTCKMGSLSNLLAVVDERLIVRNVKNLKIVDASVMPQVTRGNTNAATMMIGLKGAAMIRADLGL